MARVGAVSGAKLVDRVLGYMGAAGAHGVTTLKVVAHVHGLCCQASGPLP